MSDRPLTPQQVRYLATVTPQQAEWLWAAIPIRFYQSEFSIALSLVISEHDLHYKTRKEILEESPKYPRTPETNVRPYAPDALTQAIASLL